MIMSEIPEERYEERRLVAGILLDEGIVSINTQEPFTYASGIKSPIYCDLRLLMGKTKQREEIVRLLEKEIKTTHMGEEIDAIAGVATAGIPWAAWIAERMTKPMAYVRDSAKKHGQMKRVEGGRVEKQRMVVVEDLTSTGHSGIEAAKTLRKEGAVVERCVTIFTYELPGVEDGYKAEGISLSSLSGMSSLLEVAIDRQIIPREDEMAIREWMGHGGSSR